MRKTNILFYACALSTGILILSGCNESETPARQESPLQIAASIAPERTPSRADAVPSPSSYDKTSFQANDIIKVERKEDTPSSLTPTSCTYRLSSAGAWEWTGTETTNGPFYTYENGKTFIATYPSTFNEIAEDQTGTGFLSSNKLTAEATASDGKVNFKFTPAFTKITVIIYYQTAEAISTSNGLTLTAPKLRGGTDNNTDQSVQCLCKTVEASTEHTWSGIINPGTYTLSIKLGSTTIYTITSTEFVSATHYTYTLYRKGDRFQMSNTVTITAFGEGTPAGDEISAT
ncbi:MAG: hypothetical protein LUI85_07505 [Bacteroides sp.]|nr:hypothetical protein [Bacteroides sp.]